MADTPQTPGTGRARAHWSSVAEGIHETIAGAINGRKTDHLATILDRFEAELSPVLATFYAEHAGNAQLPDEVRALLGKITDPEHFTESLLIGVAVGATIYPILGSLIAPTTQDIGNEVWSHNPTVPLSVSQVATALLKGVKVPGGADHEASLTGVNGDRLATLVELSGNAIGPGQALVLLNQNLISVDQFNEVLRYSDMNPKFYDMALDLRYAPLSAGEIVTAVLKSHIDHESGRALFGFAGMNPNQFDIAVASAGRPPGVEQVIQLWNHGLATEAEVDQVVAQSDINPAFTDLVKQTRIYFVPPRSVVPMLRAGAITDAEADQKLAEHGVQPADRAAFIAEAHHSSASAQTIKEATASQIQRAYEEELITQADARARLAALRYSSTAIDLLIELADNTRIDRERNLAVSAMRSKYVAHGIDRPTVQANLATIGLPPAAVTQLLTLWALERDANVHKLTPAGIMKAYRMELVTPADVKARFTALGIPDADFVVHIADAFPLKELEEASAAIVSILGA